MSQPILGRIEQLTFNPHNQKSPVDSGRDKRQDELNRELFKYFDETSKVVNHNFRTLSAAIAALGTVLIENGLTTHEEIGELTEIAAQVVDEKSGVDREEFERLVKPLIEFLQTQHKKCTPYSWIIVRPNGAAFMPESSWFPFKVPDSSIACRENSV